MKIDLKNSFTKNFCVIDVKMKHRINYNIITLPK